MRRQRELKSRGQGKGGVLESGVRRGKLTNASWTAPHKQVAVASFSLDQLGS